MFSHVIKSSMKPTLAYNLVKSHHANSFNVLRTRPSHFSWPISRALATIKTNFCLTFWKMKKKTSWMIKMWWPMQLQEEFLFVSFVEYPLTWKSCLYCADIWICATIATVHFWLVSSPNKQTNEPTRTTTTIIDWNALCAAWSTNHPKSWTFLSHEFHLMSFEYFVSVSLSIKSQIKLQLYWPSHSDLIVG